MTVNYEDIPKNVAQGLYLLDTPVVAGLAVSQRSLSRYQQIRGKSRRFAQSRLQIREFLLKGTFKRGAITRSVYNELQRIVHQEEFYDGEFFHRNVLSIKENHDCCLYIVAIPNGTKDELPPDITERLDKSGLDLFATALSARIPNIVTDHDTMFYSDVKARLRKIYNMFREDEKPLEIIDSNGLAYLIEAGKVELKPVSSLKLI